MVDDDPQQRLSDEVRARLAGGPRPLDELVAELDRDGVLQYLRDDGVDEDELDDAVTAELLTDAVWDTPDGMVALATTLLDGIVVTHRVTAEELAAGEVLVTPDVGVLDWDDAPELALEGGGELEDGDGLQRPVGDDGATFTGPTGWLDGFEVGQLVAFTRTGSTVRVAAIDESALGDGEREVAALRRAASVRLIPGLGEESAPIVLDALADDVSLFRRPVPPIGELLEAAGLERKGYSFGWAGDDWQPEWKAVRTAGRRRRRAAWRLAPCCELHLTTALTALEELEAAWESASAAASASASTAAADGEPAAADIGADVLQAAAAALTHDRVAAAFADVTLGESVTGNEEVAAFAQAVLDAGPAQPAPVLLVLAAEAESAGLGVEAYELLLRARDADPANPSVAARLAIYEIDRGELRRASSLLQHAGARPDDPLVALVGRLTGDIDSAFRGVGRNDPCPCGSGRKFKQCCDRRRTVPLMARTRAVVAKLDLFAGERRWRHRLTGLASAAASLGGRDHVLDAAELAADPFIQSLAIHETGLIDEYLECRGGLLPDDERLLIDQLAEEPRRLWEIVGVEEGRSLRLRDTATGDTVDVAERAGSLDAVPGDLLFSRVVEVDGVHVLMGHVMSVPLRLRSSAIELVDAGASAYEWAEWYGWALSPPTIVGPHGEPVDLSEARLSEAGLSEAGLAALLERGRLGGDESDDDVWDDDEAEMATVLDQIIRAKEIEWLDESVPALGGLTPRQAADDPTRREDLLALLREWDREVLPGPARGFDATRLRGLLGLG